MAQEATAVATEVVVSETPTAEAPAHLTPPDASSIIPEEGFVPAEVTNIFSDEVVDEALLRGEDVSEGVETEEKPADQKASEDEETTADTPAKDVDDKPAEKDPEKVETETEDKTDEPEKKVEKPGKPPAGFVPYKALAEERSKRKELAQQLSELQEVVALVGENDGNKEEEFTALSDAEVEDLIESDPQEAMRYQIRLQRHNAKQKMVSLAKQNDEISISDGVVELQKVLPDIYEENSKSATELADFAVEKGFDPEYLTLLTDPRTRIVTPDGKTKMVLGVGAASVVKMLNELKAGSSISETSIRESLEKEITEEVTKKILAKMKGDATQISINDLPGAPEEIRGDTILSEAEMAKMSPAELEAYMRGG